MITLLLWILGIVAVAVIGLALAVCLVLYLVVRGTEYAIGRGLNL